MFIKSEGLPIAMTVGKAFTEDCRAAGSSIIPPGTWIDGNRYPAKSEPTVRAKWRGSAIRLGPQATKVRGAPASNAYGVAAALRAVAVVFAAHQADRTRRVQAG